MEQAAARARLNLCIFLVGLARLCAIGLSGAWLDQGADPAEAHLVWSGLVYRATWAPTLQLKDHVLYVEDMELKKRRKKHVSSEIFELGTHHGSQAVGGRSAPLNSLDVSAQLFHPF